jgi:hypothetical protein
MVEIVENKVTIGASVDIKNAFDSATKNFVEYFKTTDQFWKNATQRVKEHEENAHKLAKRVGGKGKEDIAGAFGTAAAGLTGFLTGFIAGAAKEAEHGIIDAVGAIITAGANEEDADNRLLSTGKVTLDGLRRLHDRFHEFGPTVGKFSNELKDEYLGLIQTTPKLLPYFETMQRMRFATQASWQSIMALSNQALIAGVKPADMPDYLRRAGAAFLKLGDDGVQAGTKVTEAFRHVQVTGTAAMNDVNSILAGITPAFQNNPMRAADALSQFINEAAKGTNDSKTMDLMRQMQSGQITPIKFFDDMMERLDPSGKDFLLRMQADDLTRDLVQNWQTQRDVIHAIADRIVTPFREWPIFSESLSRELREFAEALHELSLVLNTLLPVTNTIRAAKDALHSIVEDFKSVNAAKDALVEGVTGGKLWELYKSLLGINPAVLQYQAAKAIWNNLVRTPPPPAPLPEAPPGTYPSVEGEGKPVRFTGSDDNEADVHEMAMAAERGGAAFTPGAGESPWPMFAGVPVGDYGRGFDYGPAGVSPAGGAGAGGYYGGAGEGYDQPSSTPSAPSTPSASPSSTSPSPTTPSSPAAPAVGGDQYKSDVDWLQSRGGHDARDSSEPGGIKPEMAARLRAAGEAYEKQTGKKANFGEMFRDKARQEKYYAAYKSGRGGLAARPGYSRHEQGEATDVPRGGFLDWLHGGGAGQHGLGFLSGKAFQMDPVHVQMDRGWKGQKAPSAEASKPIKVSMEVEPPPRWQLERAARYTDQLGNRHAERQQQAKGAGDIGFA